MKLKDRIKTYNFWVSLSSAIFLLLKVLGTQFGFKVDESLFSDLITSLCGILVILGIIVPPSAKIQTESTLIDEINTESTTSTVTNSEVVEEIEVITQTPIEIQVEEEMKADENLESVTFDNKDSCEPENNESFENTLAKEESIIENLYDIEKLTSQVEKTLNNQQNLLKDHPEIYLELLNKQIDLINNN